MTRRTARALGLLIGLALALPGGQARAELTFTIQEVGGDVVVAASGTVNTAGLTLLSNWSSTVPYIRPNQGTLIISPNSTPGPIYFGMSGPSDFGSGASVTLATSSSGDTLLLEGLSGQLGLPAGYSSGAPLSSSMTFAGETFASLGVTPGTYTWTWGSGANADSVVVQVGNVAAVPGPSTLTLLAAGAAGLAMRRWRRGP